MNREIKFRAWNEVIKEMVYCDDKHYWALFNSPDSIGYGLYHRGDGHRTLSGEYNPPIMQYTGLKDKNGKEIYEGDVVTFWGGKGKIIYFDVYASFMIEYEQGSLFGLEGVNNVIGNIYENPEFLNSVLNVQGSVATDVK